MDGTPKSRSIFIEAPHQHVHRMGRCCGGTLMSCIHNKSRARCKFFLKEQSQGQSSFITQTYMGNPLIKSLKSPLQCYYHINQPCMDNPPIKTISSPLHCSLWFLLKKGGMECSSCQGQACHNMLLFSQLEVWEGSWQTHIHKMVKYSILDLASSHMFVLKIKIWTISN